MLHQSIETLQFQESDLSAEAGMVRFGPIHQSAAKTICETLQRFDLTTGADDAIRIVPLANGLVSLEVSGAHVSGYFVESDGIEAADETLDAFVRAVCPKNYPVFMKGHYFPDDATRINTMMTAVHDGVSVKWSRLRNRVRNGTSLCISTPDTAGNLTMIDCMLMG